MPNRSNSKNESSGKNTYREVNLEYGRPTVEYAVEKLRNQINECKRLHIHCLYVIHGYGSSGKGGVIRIEVRNTLMRMKTSGTIKDFINGENFNIFNSAALAMKNKYPGLEKLFSMCNQGVTVIEL